MKTKIGIALLLVAAIVLCFVLTTAIAGEKGKCKGESNEVKVTIDQVPAAVAQTLRSEAGNGTIDEIAQETKNGVVTYEADITKDGKEFEAKVAADGTLIKIKEEKQDEEGDEAGEKAEGNEAGEVTVNFADLPPAAQATIKQFAGAGTIDEVEKEVKDGATVYSADVTKDGQTFDVIVGADGKLIKTEIDKPGEEQGKAEANEPDEENEAGE